MAILEIALLFATGMAKLTLMIDSVIEIVTGEATSVVVVKQIKIAMVGVL